MNVFKQILRGSSNASLCQIHQLNKKASIIIDKNDKLIFYKEEYRQRLKKISESDYSTKLLLKEILLFDCINYIKGFIRACFSPIDIDAKIEFQEIENDSVIVGENKQPIVKKDYNFSFHNEMGIKIHNYIINLFILKAIRDKLGFDINAYPEKCSVVAFKFKKAIYVWGNDKNGNKRLTIDHSANQELLIQSNKIFCDCKASYNELHSLLEGLPYTEGKEGQKNFDIIWYKYSKQTPLTYRCFPNYLTTRYAKFPSYQENCLNQENCQHMDEYCIKQEIIHSRYKRFLNILKGLDQCEKKELILNTIDYFTKFIKADCFDSTIHETIYLNILAKLKDMAKELQNSVNETVSTQLLKMGNTIKENIWNDNHIRVRKIPKELVDLLNELGNKPDSFSSWEVLPSFHSIIPNLDGDFTPQGDIFRLVFSGLEETEEKNKNEQIENMEKPYIEANKEANVNIPIFSIDNNEEVNITELNPYSQIFIDLKAFELFKYLLDKFGGTKISHADCSFIFRRMHKDGCIYINISENDFREILSIYYQIEMEKLKTLNNCSTDNKMTIYSNAVHIINTK